MRVGLVFFASLIAILVFSCSAPLLVNGSNSSQIILDLHGVLPKTYSINANSRAIAPSTTQIRAVVTSDNFNKTFTGSYAPGQASFSMNGIPVNVALTITIDCLDTTNVVLTSATKNITLGYGQNTVSCTLVPSTTGIATLNRSSIGNAGTYSITTGQSMFFDLTLSSALYNSLPNNHDFQIIANTKSAKLLNMEIYDANWNAITPVSQDVAAGWAVITLPPGGANYKLMVSSPNATLNPEIQVRSARFVAPSGTTNASGRSNDPLLDLNTLMDGNLITNLNYYSVFLGNGNYSATSHLQWSGDCRVYGGYLPGDWKSRNANGRGSVITAASTVDGAMVLSSSATGFIEGITVQARDPQSMSGQGTTQMAMDIGSGNLVLMNSTIYGSVNPTIAGTTTALTIDLGSSAVLIGCTIDGGANISESVAMEIDGGRPYLENCLINGGQASSMAAATITTAVFLNGGSMVMSRCTVYGGSATGGTASASTTGISFVPSSAATVVIANSLISGGYATAHNSNSFGINRTTSPSTQSMIVVGSNIDSGFANNSNLSIQECINWSNGSVGTFAGNVLSEPTTTITSGYAVVRSTASNTVTFLGNTLFGSWNATSYKAFNDGTPQNSLPNNGSNYQNNVTVPTTVSVFFTSYSSIAGFSSWLAATQWWPAAGQASQFNGSLNPTTNSIIPTSDIGNYPNLLLDRAGNPRPSGVYWTRGAYQ